MPKRGILRREKPVAQNPVQSVALWIKRISERIDLSARERSFHTTPLRYTGFFRTHVQAVETQGSRRVLSGAFSKHPDLHSRVLENYAASQTAIHKALEAHFHFSCLNYGDYCLLLLVLTHSSENPSRTAGRFFLLAASMAHAGESREGHLISTSAFVCKVNTIERNPDQTFPAGPMLL